MISVQVYGDEVVANLERIPKKLQDVLRAKMEGIMDILKARSLEGTPGKYLALAQFQSGVDSIGATTIGYLSYNDKDGKYPIVPKAAAFLQFRARDGGWVRTHLVMHPYPKGAASVTAMLLQSKPWIVEQLQEAAREGFSR